VPEEMMSIERTNGTKIDGLILSYCNRLNFENILVTIEEIFIRKYFLIWHSLRMNQRRWSRSYQIRLTELLY